MKAKFLHTCLEVCLIISLLLLFGCTMSAGELCRNRGTLAQNPADGVCGNMDIRNEVRNFRRLENCTVIEGYLHIMLITIKSGEEFNYSLPKLVEITDYLMLYRVDGLKTLRDLFPNLAVIRGQQLFHNYALVAYEMRDLEELGLINLSVIMRGAARLTKNKKLCYIDTIDWRRIATGVDASAHHFMDNKDTSQCVNYCPETCPTTNFNGVEAKRCWNGIDCQKNLDCQCGKDVSCLENGLCCHEYCLGGCWNQSIRGCFACKGVIYDHECLRSCPIETYMFANRRCLTDVECLNLRNRTDNQGGNKSMLLRASEKGFGQCVMSCPKGYTVATKGKMKDMECVKCQGFCPKECNSTDVNSIQDAERLRGCSKIIGPLIIQILGGSNVAEELEKNLGDIREITGTLTVWRSYALMSFHFFKSLEIIGGENPTHLGNSLIVMDNSNLQELFPEENMKRMVIKKGKVSFHSNRKLCKYKIDKFVEYLNLSEPQEISPVTNGDLEPCFEQELKLEVKIIFHNAAVLVWDTGGEDLRNVLTYIINYKEIQDKNVNIYQGRDACSNDLWTTKEKLPVKDEIEQIGFLSKLKPYTMYAVYVQAYTLSTASSSSSMTNVETFTTNAYYPSEPRDLKVESLSSSELKVSWKAPKSPNGDVTHYKVRYIKQPLNPESFEQRNYCADPIFLPKEKTKDKVDEPAKTTNMSKNCCKCQISKEELDEEARKKEIENYFENYLQNHVYCKRYDKLPDHIKFDDFTVSQLANMQVVGQNFTLAQEKSVEDWTKYNHSVPYNRQANDSHSYDDSLVMSVEVNGLEVILHTLDHFMEYIIEVQACQDTNTNKKVDGKQCSNRAITSGTTKAVWELDLINETTINHDMITNTTGDVLIKWEPPPNPNGLIVKYHLRYKRTRSNQQNIVPVEICISQSEYRVYNGWRLSGLEAGNWTFQINAVSLAGNSSFTREQYFFIPTPPGDDSSNFIFIVTIVVVIPILIVLIVMVVWFVARYKFRHEEMTVISHNVNYVPSEQMYIMDGWEVDRDKIKLVRELGQGSFGMVYEGTAIGLGDDPDEEIRVAVKTVNDRASFNDKREFLKEATTMKAFDCYHVVKLLGVVSHGQPALVIMELMALGDLKNYLREHRPDEQERPGVSPPKLLDILQMAGEIADGMAYLAAKKFVHRDLAARNCMVDENRAVKIGDFGMTRDIYETDYYRKGGKGMLPVRWMAPESLRDGVFTTMSDVWSYGVVMWEMVTLAAQPYQGLSNEEVVKFISNGNTMDMPDNCPEEMAHLMQRCWARKPKSRPTFMEIIEYLLPNLNNRFDKVSYFFNEGGGPVEGGRGQNLDPPPEDDDEDDDGDILGEDVADDYSDNASSIDGLEGALAAPLSGTSWDQNGGLNKVENDSFYQFNELPHEFNGNESRDSNLDESFEGESLVSDRDIDRMGSDSSRSFIRGDYHSVPYTMPHSLSMPPPASQRNGDVAAASVPNSGVIELQPLISGDKPSSSSSSTAPFSLPSPNNDQPRAVPVSNYQGYQRVPLGSDGYNSAAPPNNSQPLSSLRKPQLTSGYPLTHARMDRSVPYNRLASGPSQPLGASSSPSSPSSPPPLLPSAASVVPSRPSLRLPVLNQPPGREFRRVPLFNSGSRDTNAPQRSSQQHQPPSSSFHSHIPSPDTNHVQGEGQPETDNMPLISLSNVSPPQSAVGSTSSDGSKESNKSSESYSQMNGLSNGYVRHKTANC